MRFFSAFLQWKVFWPNWKVFGLFWKVFMAIWKVFRGFRKVYPNNWKSQMVFIEI